MISHSYQSKPPVAWALAFTGIVLAATLFGGCTEPLAPMLPEWDVDANVPLIHQTYTMEDLLQEDDIIRITQDGDQVLVVSQRYPLNSISLGDHLRIDEVPFSASETFNAVRFDMPDYLDQRLNVFTLFPDLPRGEQVVAAVRNDLGVTVTMDTREYFEEMTFAEGNLSLEFTNSVPVPLRIEAIRLVDLSGATIEQITYGGLVQPAQVVTLPALDLDGLTLKNNMKLAFDISSPGSSGAVVDLSSAHSLGVKGEVTETDILSMRGYLPSQDLRYNRAIDVAEDSGMRIKDAVVSGGTLQFTLKNHFSIGAQISLTLPNTTKNGQPITASKHVSPKSTTTLTIDLDGAALKLQNETALLYDAQIVTDDASDHVVFVQKNDSVSMNGSLRNITLSSMTGTLSPTALSVRDLERSDFNFDKTIAGSIQLEKARMWASIRNQAILPVGIKDARVLGKNTSGSSANINIIPMDLVGQSETTIDFENGQVVSFLNSFSPEYPDSLGLEGTFVLNPTGAYGSISASDSVVGDLFVEFPLRFTQISGSIVDTVDMFIDEETRDNLTEVNEGTLTFDVENHLPTAVMIEPEFLDAQGRVLLAPMASTGNPLSVGAAPVDGDGYVSRSVIEKVQMHFLSEDFAKLAQAVSIRFRIFFTAEESAGAAFRTTDYVRIRGYARLNISSTITEK